MTTSAQTQADQTNQADTAARVQQQAQPAPMSIDFDSDEPLSGGVCDMSPGCESCQ